MINPSLNIWHIICLFGAFQGIFLSLLLLFNKRGNKPANLFLSLFVLVFSLRLIEIVAFWSRYLIDFPFLFTLTHPLIYLFGPLFYFYARFLLKENIGLSFKKDIIHVLPFLIHLIIYLPFYFLDSEIKIRNLERVFSGIWGTPRIEFVIIYLLQIPHLIVYVFLAFSILKSYNSKLKNHFSSLQTMNFNWLRQLLIFFALFTVSWMSYGMLIGFGADYYFSADYVLTLGMSIVVFAIAIKSVLNPEIHLQISNGVNGVKYAKSTLTQESAEKLSKDILRIMNDEKPYLNSSIKLNDFADLMNSNPHHISQVLNEKFEMNFYDFINKHRVEEFKKLLTKNNKNEFTLFALALESGFNNKTSFNNAFKKFTHLTPAQYKKQITASR